MLSNIMGLPSSAIKKDGKVSKQRKRSFSEFSTGGNPTSSCSSIGDSKAYSTASKRAKMSNASEIKTNAILNHSSPGLSKELSPLVQPRAYSKFQETEKDSLPKKGHFNHSSKGTQRLSSLGSLASIHDDTYNSNHHEIKNYSALCTYYNGLIDSNLHRKLQHETSPMAGQLVEEQAKKEGKKHTTLSPSGKKIFDERREVKSVLDLNKPKKTSKHFLRNRFHHTGTLYQHCHSVAKNLLFVSTLLGSIYFSYHCRIQKQLLSDQSNAFQLQKKDYEQQVYAIVAKLEEESRRFKESEVQQTQKIEALAAQLKDRYKSSMESELHYKQIISTQKQQIDTLVAQLEDQSISYMEAELHHKHLVATLVTQLEDQSRNSIESLSAVAYAQAEHKLAGEQQLKQDYEALLDLCQQNALHAIQAVVDEIIMQEQSQQQATVWMEPMNKSSTMLENTDIKESSNNGVKIMMATDVAAFVLQTKVAEYAHSLPTSKDNNEHDTLSTNEKSRDATTPLSFSASTSTPLGESANNSPSTEKYYDSYFPLDDESIAEEEYNEEPGDVVYGYPDDDQTEEEVVFEFENEEDFDGYEEDFNDEELFGDE